MCQQALDHLDDAILTYEQLRTKVFIPAHRISFFEQYIGSYQTAIYCCLRLGRISEALHYLERSRSKTLAEAVSGNLIPDRSEVGNELYNEFFDLRSRLHQLGLLPIIRTGAESQTEPKDRNSERSQAHHDFDSLVRRIATQFPNSAFAQRLKAAEVRYLKEVDGYVELLPDNRSCLLEFLTWANDGRLRAFLVTKQNGLELLIFPEGSLDQLDALWNRWGLVYEPSFKITESSLETLKSKGVSDEVLEELQSLKSHRITGGLKEKAEIVLETCHQLHKLIFDAEVQISREGSLHEAIIETRSWKLRDYLNTMLEAGDDKQPRRIYLIPHSFLFLMPLHAACYDEETQPRPHYLIDDYAVVYAPSAYLLKVSQQREDRQLDQPRALVVGNPQPLDELPSLRGATSEARAVARQLRRAGWTVDQLIKKRATKQHFLSGDEARIAGINSGLYSHLHLAQHAGIGNRGHQPLRLLLAAQHAGISNFGHHTYLCFGQPSADVPPEQYLCEAAEIAGASLQNTESALIAGCLTSFALLLSEYLGTSAAFLQAGVGTCIGTIYALSDEGSRWLVPELYRLHLEEGLSWADALRRAQLWMAGGLASGTSRGERKETMGEAELELLEESLIPVDHPYHWAAFTLSGKA